MGFVPPHVAVLFPKLLGAIPTPKRRPVGPGVIACMCPIVRLPERRPPWMLAPPVGNLEPDLVTPEPLDMPPVT